MAQPARVLIVEDFAPFRRYLSAKVQGSTDLQVIGEVEDGLEAVKKAEELQPDLVLMDVHIPKLNGIEATRQILKISPNSKVLFVSQDSSPLVVEAALNAGASGYLIKTDAERELMMAMEAVLQGRRFVTNNVRHLSD
jgi:DNA-binding NarL/FixJ family response regulator